MTEKDLHTKSIMDSLLAGNILEREAADMLVLSLRQTQRIKKRIRTEGDTGIIHQLRGKKSNHHHDPTKYDQAIDLIQQNYSDYSYVMMHEKLRDNHQIILSMPTLRNELIHRGIRVVKKQRKTDIQRTMRERKSCSGEMVQYDGSYHLWFENRAPEACLLVSVDDATGKVSARFDHSEGLWPTYRFWRYYLETRGKPKSIYLDRFSTYKINHPNATDDHELTTQFGRVCKKLGIELIFAHSPQGKGRVERMNGTLQDRLVKELREAGIPHMTETGEFPSVSKIFEEANTFLDEIFLPKFNAQFQVEPQSTSDMHIQLRDDEQGELDEIFTQQQLRKVHNDFTIHFEGKILQLYRSKAGGSIVNKGEHVYVDRSMDSTIHIHNKNHHSVISKELKALPIRSASLSLPPMIGEDVILLKAEHIKSMREEKELKQMQEKHIRDEEKKCLSLARQAFHLEHGRHAKYPIPISS